MEKWRLLDFETPDRASMNLAIEEAILIQKTEREVPTTVRFWRNRRAVVVGYSQSVEAEVNLELCKEEGVRIVRRFSGGGAVYHDLGNLNFSVAIEMDHPFLKGLDIAESYGLFSSAVIEGLKEFGVRSVFEPPGDILVGDKKISGNAQSRKRGTILHHGTLLVNADLSLLTKVLIGPKEVAKSGKTTSRKKPVTSLAEEIGYQARMGKVKEALQRGFEKAFSMELIQGTLTSKEKMMAESLYAGKYSKNEWNFWR